MLGLKPGRNNQPRLTGESMLSSAAYLVAWGKGLFARDMPAQVQNLDATGSSYQSTTQIWAENTGGDPVVSPTVL